MLQDLKGVLFYAMMVLALWIFATKSCQSPIDRFQKWREDRQEQRQERREQWQDRFQDDEQGWRRRRFRFG